MGEAIVWVVINKEGNLVGWKSESDGEEGLEVHRTEELAKGSAFHNEKVLPARIIWE